MIVLLTLSINILYFFVYATSLCTVKNVCSFPLHKHSSPYPDVS